MDEEPEQAYPVLRAPRDGVPPVITDQADLDSAVRTLAAGSGPVAVDAERASGYRYGQAAYLIQLRRRAVAEDPATAGPTVLVDPVARLDLRGLADVLHGPEWVLHAASQDLPCLAELGLRPARLFDTELGARLAGLPKVGLAAVTEQFAQVTLAKEHSAVDWSTRPLPESWLAYAALDVELLLDVRDRLEELLVEQGKLAWAEEEFAAVLAAPPAPARVDPWRRTSGVHKLRSRRAQAVVRSLWQVREQLAAGRDVAPGRLLPDAAIVNAAQRLPTTTAELALLPVFSGPSNRRNGRLWQDAIDEARALPEAELPGPPARTDAPPPPRAWGERDPEAARRLAAVRPALVALAAEHDLPAENLLTPDTARRLAWSPPEVVDLAGVADFLASRGARTWQVDLTAGVLLAALEKAAHAPVAAAPVLDAGADEHTEPEAAPGADGSRPVVTGE